MTTRRSLVLATLTAVGALAAGSMPAALAAPKDDLVAVVGANGRTGVNVVEQLVARGYKVRALVRDAAAAQGKLPAGVEVVVADVRDPNTLAPALKGAKYVVSLLTTASLGNQLTWYVLTRYSTTWLTGIAYSAAWNSSFASAISSRW